MLQKLGTRHPRRLEQQNSLNTKARSKLDVSLCLNDVLRTPLLVKLWEVVSQHLKDLRRAEDKMIQVQFMPFRSCHERNCLWVLFERDTRTTKKDQASKRDMLA